LADQVDIDINHLIIFAVDVDSVKSGMVVMVDQ